LGKAKKAFQTLKGSRGSSQISMLVLWGFKCFRDF